MTHLTSYPCSSCFATTGALVVVALLLALLRLSEAAPPAYCPYPKGIISPTPTIFRPNPPRVFPFCIGKDPETNSWDDEIKTLGFDKYIDQINKDRFSKQATKGWSGFRYDSDNDFLFQDKSKSGFFYKPKGVYAQFLNHRYRATVTALMDNWLQIDLYGLWEKGNVVFEVHGLYVQAIQGPLGIPFGQFLSVEFTPDVLNPDPGGSTLAPYGLQPAPPKAEYFDRLRFYPCTFYPRAGISIPNVLLWRKPPSYLGHEGRVSFTFRWDEHACAEVAYFQFLVIVIYDWSTTYNYHVGLSNVVFPGVLGFGTSGIGFPYYPEFGKDEYHASTDRRILTDFLNPVVVPAGDARKLRIIPNFEYEQCVQHHVGLVKTGSQKGSCPPGPFQCSSSTLAMRNGSTPIKDYKEIIWKNMYVAYNSYRFDRPECDPPSLTTTTTSTTTTTTTTTTAAPVPTGFPPVPTLPSPTTRLPTITDNQTKIAVRAAKKTEKRKVISHGDICVLVWFFIIPMSNYLARFFKDFANSDTLGVGFWIVGHVLCHHIGVLLMWISFGLVVSNGISFLGGAAATHYIFGFPAVFIQHYELFNGFIRDRKPQVAHRQSLSHAICGYLSCILGLVCAASTRITKIKSYVVYALFVITVCAIAAGSVVENKIAKSLAMYPPRKVFPVLERIMMVNTRPRFCKSKLLVFLAYFLTTAGFYFLYWVYDESPYLQNILP